MPTCTTTVSGTTARLIVEEDIDLITRPRIEAAVGALPQSVTDVTLSLEGAQFMDVAGLRLLHGLRDQAATGARHFVVTDLGVQPVRLLRLAAEIAPSERWEEFLPAPVR